MASNYSQINLGIKTNVDLSSIQKLKAELQQVRAIADHADFGFEPGQINSIIHSANTLERALTSAFDVDLNTVNIEKFNKYIKQSGLSLNQIQKDLVATGPVGQRAFLTATSSLLKMNTALKQTNKFLDDIAESFGNTVRWTIMSSIINNISSTIQQSYYYIKDLDSSLNDIRIVTGKSADEMERFAVEANDAAKALAVSTKDYTEGSLIYYQQGLDDQTVKTLTDITAMTSNVTGQSMETVSEQLTAVWNGYQVANQAAEEGMGVYQEYVDKMAAVGAATASDLQELATAMSKVASAANAMGVDFDQLSAQIATIVSVTRQAPESVGTALKTIYARIGDLKVDGVDEFGTTLGEVSSNLAKVGIEVVDTNGEMRDIGQVMEEVAAKWDTWNESQQQAIAISIAGKRQYNNLLALFENWDMYTETLDTAANAAGTLNEQQEIALESINNKMDILKATAEDLYDNLFDEDSIKDIIDALTSLLQIVADVVDAIGGLETILPMLGGIGVKVFSKQISGSLTTFLTNIKISNQEVANMKRTMEQVQTLFSNSSLFDVQNAGSQAAADSLKDITEFYNYFSQSQQSMTQAQKEEYNQILQQKVALGEKKIQLEEEQTIWKNINSHLKLFDAQIIDMPSGLENISGELNKINQLVRRINDQSIRTDIESNDINGATKQLVNYLHTLDLSRNSIKKITERFGELINNGRNVNEALEVIGNELNELGQQSSNVRNLTQDTKILGEITKKAGQDFKENFDLDSAIRNVTGMIGGLSQLASGLSMIKNLADIWNDDTLSSWEKFLQITINLTMTLPMIGNGISSIAKGWKSLPTVINNLAVAIGGLSGAEATAALATKGFGASLKGLAGVLGKALAAAGPYIIGIIALTAVVWGVVKAFNKKNDMIKANTKALNEYKETAEELKELEDKLKTTTDRINELYDIAENRDLTIVEKEELTKLESENKLLETQIALQEELNNKKKKEAIKTAKENAKEDVYGIKDDNNKLSNKGLYIGNYRGINIDNPFAGAEELYEDYGEDFDPTLATGNEADRQEALRWVLTDEDLGFALEDLDLSNRYQVKTYIQKMQEMIDLAKLEGRENIANYLETSVLNPFKEQTLKISKSGDEEDLDDRLTNAFDNLELLESEENKDEESINYYKDIIVDTYYRVGTAENNFSDAFSNVFSSNEEIQNLYDNLDKILIDGNTNEINEELLKTTIGEDNFNKLKEQADILKISIYDLLDGAELYNIKLKDISKETNTRSRKSFKDFSKDVQKLHDDFDALTNVYKDVKDGGAFDFSNLLGNEDFEKAFGNLDSYEEFLKIISESPDDIKKCQNAFNKLSSEYIKQTGILDNLSEETREVAINVLEQEGIENATEVVDYYLKVADAIDEVAKIKDKLGYTTKEVTDLTEDQLKELLEEEEATGTVRNEIYKLYLEQAMLKDNPVETKDSVIALRNLVGEASAAGIALTELATIMERIDTVDNTLKNIHLPDAVREKLEKEREELLEKAGNIKDTAYENFFNPPDVDFGGNKSSDKNKDKKDLEDEIDRYWDLNKALEAVTETISDLDKLQSHLHGKELISSLEKENKLLEQQAERYKAINAEQMREADELRKKLSSTYAVAFDINGGIANYAEAMTRMLNWYNSNLGNEAVEKSYENFKKLLERYEQLYYEEMIDTQNKLNDIFYQQLENNLKAWETDLEINLGLEEAEREWSDFVKNMGEDFKAVYKDLDKEFENIVKKMSTYVDEGTIDIDIKAIQNVLYEIKKLESGGVSSMFASVSEAQEKLKELQGTLMDDAEAAHDLWVEAWEAYLEGIDQAADKFDDLMEKLEEINDELDYQRELTELLYGEDAYDIYNKIFEAQLKNSVEEIKSLKQQEEFWKRMYEAAEEGSEEQLKYFELMKEAQSELNDRTLEFIKLSQDAYKNSVDEAIDSFNKFMTNDLGTDKIKEEWEERIWYAERYFDEVEKIYNLEILSNEFNKSISNTSTLEQQQALKEMQEEELALLKDKEHISEYDIELINKRRAAKEAEFALEDARNAKSSMKLVRGANGNWEYQYVTDESDVLQKEGEVLKAYQDLYDFSKKAKKTAMEDYIEQTNAYEKEIAEAAEKYKDNTELLNAELARINDKYYNKDSGILTLIIKDYNKTEQDLIRSVEIATLGSYENIKNSLQQTLTENLGIWSESTKAIIDMWNADEGDSVRAKVQEATNSIIKNSEEYQKKVGEVAEAVGENFSEEGIKGAIDNAAAATDSLKDATKELCDEAYIYLTEYKSIVDEIALSWEEVYEAAKKAMNASLEAVQSSNSSSGTVSTPTQQPTSGGGGGSGASPSNSPKVGDSKHITEMAHYDAEGALDSNHPPQSTNRIMYLKEIHPNAKYPYGISKTKTSSRYGWVSAFDTGGYTGDWSGGDGRLAMLHEKELVLNKADTKNILDTVNTIRDLGSVTSSIGSAIVNTVKSMVMEAMGIKTGANYNTQNSDISTNNTFEIHAEFPNANDVSSIREAILSLPNLASQFISKNKK